MKHLNFFKKTAVLVMAGAVGFSMFFLQLMFTQLIIQIMKRDQNMSFTL